MKITPHEKRQHTVGREKNEALSVVPYFSLSPPCVTFSRVGWFSRALAFRSRYYPWGKMGTTRSLSQDLQSFSLYFDLNKLFDFGPEKLPKLSRNGPEDGKTIFLPIKISLRLCIKKFLGEKNNECHHFFMKKGVLKRSNKAEANCPRLISFRGLSLIFWQIFPLLLYKSLAPSSCTFGLTLLTDSTNRHHCLQGSLAYCLIDSLTDQCLANSLTWLNTVLSS